MRAAIVLDESMGPGLLANATACITTGLFNGRSEALGPGIEGDDCTFIPITKIPILVLKRGQRDFLSLLERAKANGLTYMLFTKEGQSTTSYEQYIDRVRGKRADDVTIVGIGAIGDSDAVTKFAGDLPLLR